MEYKQKQNLILLSLDKDANLKASKRFALNTKNAAWIAKCNGVQNFSAYNEKHYNNMLDKALRDDVVYGVVLSNGWMYASPSIDLAKSVLYSDWEGQLAFTM